MKKLIAKIIHNAIRAHIAYKRTHTGKFHYNLEIPKIGIRECETMSEVFQYLSKYIPEHFAI